MRGKISKIFFIYGLVLLSCISILMIIQFGRKQLSVTVKFENVENRQFYVAVLKQEESDQKYNIAEERNIKILNSIKKCVNTDDWHVDFVAQYHENMDLYWECNNIKPFKVLIYFPETDSYEITKVCQSFTTQNIYIIHMNDIKHGKEIIPIKSHKISIVIASFILGACLCMLIELTVANLFHFTNKKFLHFIIGLNSVLEIMLGGYLFNIAYKMGIFILFTYLLCICFFLLIIKTVLYIIAAKRILQEKIAKVVVYSVISNAISNIAGIFLALILPGIH